MPTTRRAIQSPVFQGVDEIVAYKFDFGRWGTPAGTPIFKIYDMSTGKSDVSTTNLSGTSGISGSLAFSPFVVLLTDGVTYRLEGAAMINGNLLIGYLLIVGEE